MKTLNEIIKEMLEKHEGGEKFFNHLDKAMQNISIVDQLVNLIGNEIEEYNIIVSGKFGRYFNSIISHPVVVVNGGLRKGSSIDDLSYLECSDKEFIFIDDSFYSGKTRNAIEKELNKNNAELTKTFVIYDGSVDRDLAVESLYRYYK